MKRTRKYIKKLIPYKTFIILIIAILISNIITTQKEDKFKKTYENISSIEVEAIIKSQIQEKEYGNEFKIEIIKCKQNPKIIKTKLIVTDNKKENLKYGDIIKIKGEYEKIVSFKNRGVFNYEKHLRKENIYGKLKVETIRKIGKEDNLYTIFININKAIKSKFENNFTYQESSMLKALIIGDKSQVDEKIKENFQDNGLSHILAISGMHISCLIIIFQKIIDRILKNNKKKKISIILILIIYGLVIGFLPSAIRAIIMTDLAIISKLFYRKNNQSIDIAIACLIIIIYNPYYIIDSGFLLSFGATIGIIYIFPKINKIQVKNKFLKYFFEIFIVSISVNIAIFPIMIYFFKKISISFFITGLILTPLVFLIEILGIAIIFMPQFIIEIIKPIVEIIMGLFIKISEINLGKFYIKVPTVLEIISYYLIVIYFFKLCSRKSLNLILKKTIVVLITISICTNIFQNCKNYLLINFIDVGQGDSCLIQTPENKNILIDGGGSDNYDIGKNVVIPYLLSKKINKIDYLMISHFDTDHVRTDC